MRLFFALFALPFPLLAQTQTVTLPGLEVKVSRTAPTETRPSPALRILPTPERYQPAALPSDLALRQAPEFSLFRRGTSLDLNPTAQGVSLRGIGPSGASRTLVLWDGIPLNDAFGGWVNWSKVPSGGLAQVEIAPGGEASTWGNTSLSGVIYLNSRNSLPGELRVDTMAGSFGTWSVSGELTAKAAGALTLEGSRLSREGPTPVRSDQRGAVDTNASLRVERASARWLSSPTKWGRWSAHTRWFSEERGNGTLGQNNGTRERWASAGWESPTSFNLKAEGRAYVQAQTYRSTFTAVSADRSRETPASEQYDVPATAAGTAWTLRGPEAAAVSWQIGADARQVVGETRERFLYSNGQYTRDRRAGATQGLAGAFAQASTQWRSWILQGSLRQDGWRESDGHRREIDLLSGAVVRNEQQPHRRGAETSPRLSLGQEARSGWGWQAEGYRRFRRPTLNELYRPFRQGSDQTEANPALRTESILGLEGGVHYRRDTTRVQARYFHAEVSDAVANVTLARGPGTYPDFGFIPAGGTGRRRLNLDRLVVEGVQLDAAWVPFRTVAGQVSWLWSDSEVTRASVAPTLVGKRPPQTPTHVITGSVDWTVNEKLAFSAQTRWSDEAYEDDDNRLALPSAWVADLSALYRLTSQTTLRLGARNVAGAEVETSRLATGLVTLGQPREFWVALTWQH